MQRKEASVVERQLSGGNKAMKRSLTYLASTGVALLLGIAASQPASATIIAAGSFSFTPVPGGTVTVSGGGSSDINLGTISKTEPALAVDAVNGNLTLAIAAGNTVTLNPNPVPLAPGTSTASISEILSVGGLTFTFTSETTVIRLATSASLPGEILEQYTGTLTNGAGIFTAGTPVTWSETCTQAGPGAVIDCGNSVLTTGVPEPASLAIFGAALAGLGVLRRRRKAA